MKEMYFNFLVVFFFSKYYHTIIKAQKNGILNFYILVFSFSILLMMGMFYVILLINSKRIIGMTFPSYFGMNLRTWYVFWWWVWAMFWNSVSIIVWLLHLFVLRDWFLKNKIKYWWKLRKKRFGLRMESLKVEYF
jgi:hypothetical protein